VAVIGVRLVVAAGPDQRGDQRDAGDLGDLRGPAGLGLGHGELEDPGRGRGVIQQPDLTHHVRREGPGQPGIPGSATARSACRRAAGWSDR
jgi:hypothetical protein